MEPGIGGGLERKICQRVRRQEFRIATRAHNEARDQRDCENYRWFHHQPATQVIVLGEDHHEKEVPMANGSESCHRLTFAVAAHYRTHSAWSLIRSKATSLPRPLPFLARGRDCGRP